MGLYIPDDKISEIKHSADIVDIISEAVLLKKAGRNYVGLCPFHAEKTPSFTVSAEKQMFHCFGCGEGGNVFTFLMKHQGLSFPEAAMMLARRYNIHIPQPEMSPARKKAASEKDTLLAITKQAAAFYRSQLDGAAGAKARRYLEERGLSGEVVEAFEIGYAPAGWSHLVNFFRQKSVPLKMVEKAGLIVRKNDYYDRFRDRIIFPTTDITGRIVGFGGRVLDDSLPKYLNSPETPLYNKRRILYGLGRVKQHCRQERTVYITEGYMDFLALYRHGLKNAVATLGTSLTAEHVRILRGYVARAVLVFDSDEAGLKAARRAVEIFDREKGLDPYILTLPEGHDPDTYLSEFGTEAFLKLAAGARGAVSFLMDSAVNRHGLSVEGKIRIVTEMAENLAKIEDGVARAVYIRELAERVEIDETAVLEKVRAVGSGCRGRDRSGEYPQAPVDSNGSAAARAIAAGESRRERQVVAMMIHIPAIMEEIEQRGVLEYFDNPLLKAVGRLLLDNRRLVSQGGRLDDLMEVLQDPDQRQILTSLTVGDELCNWEDMEGCRRLINQVIENRRNRRDSLSRLIQSAEETNDAKLDALLRAKKEQKKDQIKKMMHEGEKTL